MAKNGDHVRPGNTVVFEIVEHLPNSHVLAHLKVHCVGF